jgi:hypothetical protein
VLAAPFVQMVTMYEYGCEKHYKGYKNRRRNRTGVMKKSDMDAMKQRIAAAEARLRGRR